MTQKNILFLTSNFPPNLSVGTQRVTKILKYINKEEFRFFILTLKEDYFPADLDSYLKNGRVFPENVVVSRTDKLELTRGFTKLKAFLKKAVNGKPQTKPKTTSSANKETAVRKKGALKKVENHIRNWLFSIFEFPDKFIGWLPYAIKQGVRLIRENNIDTILTTAPPHSLFIMAWLIKKRTGAKLILDFRDPWALSIWDYSKSFKSRLEQYYERKVINAADQVLFVTEKMRDRYAEFYGDRLAEKFAFFSNGFDPDDFADLENGAAQNEPDDVLRFVHLGSLYKKRNPEPLFHALAQLIKEGKVDPTALKMEFIGFVATELEYLNKKVEELNLEQVVFFKDSVGFRESLTIMQQSNVLLIIQPGTDMQIPAKLFEYMYAGKPIFAMAEPDSATEATILKGNLGYVAPSSDVDIISQKLLQMIKALNSKDQKAVEGYVDKFNMAKAIKRFENIIRSV